MTKQEFQKLTENLLFLDGATGSNLMAQGMPRGICTERWVIELRDVIQKLQILYRSRKPDHLCPHLRREPAEPEAARTGK